MRVFYSVTFHEETKNKLVEYKNLVAHNSVEGRFTNKDNFHLTLEFIGEVDEKKLIQLKSIIYKLKNYPKYIRASHIGSFKRGDKEIVWLGIEENRDLITLQKELRNLLVANEFKVENRRYRPHITIGREIVRKDSIEKNISPPIDLTITSIALMESKRVNNKLVYEPLEEKFLQYK